MKHIICHYHIYKNSGTSFDRLLQMNYGDQYISFDGPFPFFTIDQEQLDRIIERKTDVIALSSHQIQLPVPVSLDYNVLPVVFLRHPLLRVYSIYNFKRKTFDGTSTSKAAIEMSFDEWVGYCMTNALEITQISNAQTRLLSAAYRQRPLIRRSSSGMIYDLNQAVRNLQTVSLLARTEYFDNDVSRFPEILEQYGIHFEFREIDPQNTTSKNINKPIDERVDTIKNDLTKSNFQRLLLANDQDFELFDYASKRIDNDRFHTKDK